MRGQPRSWTIEHFSQANPEGAGQGDVSALPRCVAATLEQLGPVDVADLVVHAEITADGGWPSLTVYVYRLPEPDADAPTG
jgi:hypothetical protein